MSQGTRSGVLKKGLVDSSRKDQNRKRTFDELIQVPADEEEDEGVAPILGSAGSSSQAENELGGGWNAEKGEEEEN